MRMTTVLALALVLLAASTALADITPIDLSSWTARTLDLPGGQSAGNWVLSNGNTTVTQTINADPSFYTNNLDATEYTMNGTWQVTTGGDDDFMGFVIGYQDPAHCYIFDWKQAYQNEGGYGIAQEGMSVKKISAASEADLTITDFWQSEDTEHMTVLASNWGAGTGYSDNTLYTFDLEVVVGAFTIRVFEEDTLLWEVTVNDATYIGGQFGFYNYSQAYVEYSGFTLNIPPVCDAGGPYSGDAGQPVQFDGSGSFDEDGEIVAWEWDFGDGGTGSGVNPTHIYQEDGDYQVTLCVTDDEGLTRCCTTGEPAVSTETRSWDSMKALYR